MIQTRLLILLGVLFAFLLEGLVVGVIAYRKGDRAGAQRVTNEWVEVQTQARKETDDIRTEGHALAEANLARARKAEELYARNDAKYRRALATQLVCPANGRIGDVVLPADLVDSMFNREDAGIGSSPATP